MKNNPYKSVLQRGKFHAMKKKGEIASKIVKKYDKASKGKILPFKWSNPSDEHWVSDIKTAINALTGILDQSDNSKAFIKQKITILDTISHLLNDAREALLKKTKK